jgi:diguanylate cyclase (GGDEF)-like protein
VTAARRNRRHRGASATLAPQARVALVGAGVAATAVGLLVHAATLGVEAPASGLTIPWWALFAAFCLAERAIIPVYPMRGSRSQFSFSLTELPLVLGLFFVDPAAVVATRVLAGLLMMYAEGNRDPLKQFYNASIFAIEVAVALHLYHVVFAAPSPAAPLGWLAVLLAVGTGSLIGALMVPIAVSLMTGTWHFDRVPQILTLALVAGSVNTSLGLISVLLLRADPRTAWLLALVAGVLFLAYRGYTSLSGKHESLVALHQFTQRVSRILDLRETTERLLREAMELLRTDYAEIVTVDAGAPNRVTVRSLRGDGELVVAAAELRTLPVHRRVIDGHAPVLVPRNPKDEALAELLAGRDVADAVLVPLPETSGGGRGLLLMGGRLGLLTPFTEDDVRLCQTVANHASVLLENGRLVDRLRDEVADKEHQASHDALTGLPNRSLFHERVQRAVLDARGSGSAVAVMLLDLDRFKEVNDTLGHHIGDDLLQEVGKRLRESVKAGDTVARLGGDEFAILLPSVRDGAQAVEVASRARRALEAPFEMGELTLVVGASLGIALAPEHGDLATVLLQRADVAMYAAKTAHAGVVVYSAEVDTHSPRRLALVGELRKAIERDELLVHFQPKADALTGRITGAEALVRWLHPTEGPISPDEFIPIAERTGMIHDLTDRVLEQSLHQCAAWRRAGRRIDVAVNVSAGSLLDLDFPEQVRAHLDAASVAPSSLTLEITESSIMADPKRSLRVLSALSAMGVRLAIDDFGTGYSSLSQLKQMPVDELKIDRSFIQDMISDDDDATIVRSTVDLGHNLGLRLVAEGVEDAETWRRLRTLGCDVVQGYYLSRPLEAHSFERWLAEWDSGIEQRILPPVDERARRVVDAEALELLRTEGIDVDGLGLDGPL